MSAVNIYDQGLAQVVSGLAGPRGGLPLPTRTALMKQQSAPADLRRLDLFVHRNHAFEFVADLLPPFLWITGHHPQVTYGDYDDSLGFAHLQEPSLQLISLDFDRYAESGHGSEFQQWLEDRLRYLRARCTGPLLVGNWPSESPAATALNDYLQALSGKISGLRVWDVQALRRQLNLPFFDDRAARFKGTRFSDAACILMARDLGLIRLPSLVRPRLKAIAVDLDNTLYEGVLGEDGPGDIAISPTHTEIHRELLRLRGQGIFLALASRNEPRDVEELFASRRDLTLQLTDFSATSIGWHSKVEGIERIASELRIGPEAILFIDDNPGELAQVSRAFPDLSTLHATTAEHTLFWLRNFPFLHGYVHGATDELRIADLAADKERVRLRGSTPDPREYLASLAVEVTLAWDPDWQLDRLVEISQKTNQFNTGLHRFSAAEIARRLQSPDCAIISFAMRDRLSDSGNIGALHAHVDAGSLVVDELAISCRALGRNIENTMVTVALQALVERFGVRRVDFIFHEGPRNSPARTWLAAYLGVESIADGSRVGVDWDRLPARQAHLALPIVCHWEEKK